MRLFRIPSLALSLLIQLAPMLRVATADAAFVLSPVMAVLRMIVGASAIAGSYHAVSGATAPTISSSKTKIGAVGVDFSYRILLSGGSPESFEATPIPSGVALNLIKDRNGRVTGAELKGLPTGTEKLVSTITAWDNPDFTGRTSSGEVTFLIADIAPMEASVSTGQSVTFNALGTQETTTGFRWFHNDVEIAPPEGTNSFLTRSAVTDADAGQYRVRISFGNTFTFTRRATLTVIPSATPPVLTESPTDATVHLGEPLTLRAAATGEGTLTFAWTRNGDPVPEQTSSSLLFPVVTSEQAGLYRVTVTGSGGSATSGPATVIVADPLVIGSATLASELLRVPFNGISGRNYRLERRSTLGSGDWTPAGELQVGESSAFAVPGPLTDSQIFRIRTE
jgi:Immunoglobulin domain